MRIAFIKFTSRHKVLKVKYFVGKRLTENPKENVSDGIGKFVTFETSKLIVHRDIRFKVLLLVLLLTGELNAIVIECLYEFDYFYFCHGRVVDGNMNPNITDVVGQQIGNRTLNDVDSVRIVGQGLTVFPGNIEKFFPKATKVDLGQNRITHITNAEIRTIPKLRDLVLWGNSLTELEGNLLEGMCYFKFLDVDFNKIQHVGYNFQFPENGLLFMQQNPCIHLTVFGVLEVIRVKSLFRSKCPPLGATAFIPEASATFIPESVRKDVQTQNMHDQMLLLEERLALLEAKIANAIEIRINGSNVKDSN